VPFFVSPGSQRIAATAGDSLAALRDIGAVILANACGPCIGQWRRDDHGRNSIVTSFNRNFRGRNDGRLETSAFLASPEMVTALALAGRLSFDPLADELVGADGEKFRLAPPKTTPMPELVQTHGCIEPSGGEIHFRAHSQRLQPLPLWPAWDGKDFLELPVLMKTQGKTTTDAISPAGPWLQLRGHLDRFSENLLYGAVNAFTGETGFIHGERPAAVARRLRRWMLVGDENYGEGSSREHAALSPRRLGCVAVIARSFARIHESNLKKQGLLALTFASSDDWNRIGENDLLSLIDLDKLSPDRAVDCIVTHSDGSREKLQLLHTYSRSQLEWFRRGSALSSIT
jgi:aconitate hydratase